MSKSQQSLGSADEGVAAQRLDALFQALSSIEADLSLPLLLTLVAVGRFPSLSINDLSDRIGVPQQTASRYVAILQGRYQIAGGSANTFSRNPLVTLEVSSDDPRRRALFLTPHGKARLVALMDKLYAKGNAEEP